MNILTKAILYLAVLILVIAVYVSIISSATWLVCNLWGIPFNWKIAAGAVVIHLCLPHKWKKEKEKATDLESILKKYRK